MHHDSRSWGFEFDTTELSIQSVEWKRELLILDQGNVGSCTADAAIGLLGTAPLVSDKLMSLIGQKYGSFDQNCAYKLYSDEEDLDGDGPYPPNDNGSSGLTSAKALRNAGIITGWSQTFSLEDAMKALTVTPFITGTVWYNSMFRPDADGLVTVDTSSGIAGGHEYEVVGFDAVKGLVKFANSWGNSWGRDGYFYLSVTDYGTLLYNNGDVTIFSLELAPQPVDPDAKLAVVAKEWVSHPHVGSNNVMAKALKVWLKTSGR